MTIISGSELCQANALLWTTHIGSKQFRVLADLGVQVERIGSGIYRANALPITSATTALATVFLKASQSNRIWHVRIADTHPFDVYPSGACLFSECASDCSGLWSRRYAQLAVIKPPAYIRTLRRTMVGSYDSVYLALLPNGAVYKLGNKRTVLMLAKCGEPTAAHLVRAAGWFSDVEEAWI